MNPNIIPGKMLTYDRDILKKKTLQQQQQHLKDLRVLLKFKKIEGKSLEDQENFPTWPEALNCLSRSRHTTNLVNVGGG